MKNYIVIIGICMLINFCFSVCSKSNSGGSGGGITPVVEENLIIGIDPDPGNAVAPSIGATYDFKILIKSKMPATGVMIEIVCTRDADNSSVSSQTITGSVTPLTVSVSNLQPGVLCTVKITVTSISKSSNTASLNFKLARK